MTETYKATGQANRSTFMRCEGASKHEVVRAIRQSTEANRFEGNESSWTVYRKSDGAAVAGGGMDSTGRRYRLRDDYLKHITDY